MNYRAEIDGLRALAVLPVILFHAGFEWFSGGFVGVDVFFVISGYLITTIIINEIARGKFSIVNFYERRARRILPALFFVMAACLPFAWLWLIPSDLKDFGQSLAAVSTFSSNILFWWESGYFDTAAELKPLLHTWSLAVEEQYYILYPIFLMLIWRLGIKWILVLLSLVFVVSLSVAHWATNDNTHPRIISGAFFLLPTRGWELLVGVFAAFYLKHNAHLKSHITNQIFSILGFGMIVYSIVAFDKSTPFPSLYTLIPTAGTGLLILSAVPKTFVHRLLSFSPIVGIGLISYSAYLWHQPLLAFARYRSLSEVSVFLLITLCLASLIMAFISWRFVEKPFRDKKKTDRKVIFSFSLIGILIFSFVGWIGNEYDGFQSIKYKKLNTWLVSKNVRGYVHNNKLLQEESWKLIRSISNSDEYEPDSHDNKLWFDLNDSERKKILLVGNSHSKDLFNVLSYASSITDKFQLARYGTQIRNIDDKLFVSPNYMSADAVIIVSRYENEDLTEIPYLIERMLSDSKRVFLSDEIFNFHASTGNTIADDVIQSNFTNVDLVSELAVLVNAKYTKQFNDGYSGRMYDRWSTVSEEINRIANSYDKVTLLNRMEYVCPSGMCYGVDSSLTKLFYDYGHHTLVGAMFFGDHLSNSSFFMDLVEGMAK